jgi:hypothetical protein
VFLQKPSVWAECRFSSSPTRGRPLKRRFLLRLPERGALLRVVAQVLVEFRGRRAREEREASSVVADTCGVASCMGGFSVSLPSDLGYMVHLCGFRAKPALTEAAIL